MNLDFTTRRFTLVVVTTDLRCGYNRLAGIALQYLHIDVSREEDYVVFVSRTRRSVKIIGHDAKGTVMLCRKLDQGNFVRLLAAAAGPATRRLTVNE